MTIFEVDLQEVEDALSAVKKSVASYEEYIQETDRIQDSQSSVKWDTKWGPKSGPKFVSSTFRDCVAQTHQAVDRWSQDMDMVISWIRQAQEALQGASEEEAVAINARLVEEWRRQTIASSSSEPEETGPCLGLEASVPGNIDNSND